MNPADRRRVIEIHVDTLIGKMDQTRPSIDVQMAGEGILPGNLHFFPSIGHFPRILCSEFRNIPWNGYTRNWSHAEFVISSLLLQIVSDHCDLLLDIDWENDIDNQFIIWFGINLDGVTLYTSLPESVEILADITKEMPQKFHLLFH